MKKLVVLFVFAAVLALPVSATAVGPCTGSVCIVSVSPDAISSGTPTLVTVKATVSDPAFLPGSMYLYKVNSVGKVTAVLGTFNDNGTNGDEVSGDGVHTIQVTLNETSTT